MSWSLSTEVITDVNEVRDTVEAAGDAFLAINSDTDAAKRAMRDQILQAADCAQHLVPVVGGPPVRVTANGHANPDHKPRSGWADDSVTITVSQAPRG